MGNGFLKNRKGQVSIEFILIILIALIYINSVLQPTLRIASQGTEDVTRLAQAKLAAQKIATSINQLYANQGEGKKTISIFVPQDSIVECDAANSRINFKATLSNPRNCKNDTGGRLECPTGCDESAPSQMSCEGFIELIQGADPACAFGDPPVEYINASSGNIFREIVIVKSVSGIGVSYAS